MGISRTALRQRLAAHLAAQLSGWSESPYPIDQFGREPASLAHLAFSVGLGRSVPYGGRQRRNTGAAVTTTVRIAFSYQLRQNLYDKVTDADAAETASAELITAVMGVDATGTSKPYLSEVEQPVSVGEYVRHAVVITVNHILDLE